MKFSQYINEWLYGPQGYYTTLPSIGKRGDFYTSVSASMFFGGTLGKMIVDCVKRGEISENATIVEFGVHQGYMLGDIIQFIYTLEPKLLKSLNFVVVEPIAKLRKIQKEYFQKAFQDAVSIKILPSIHEFCGEDVLVLSNELFDAFPCEVIYDEQMLHIKNNIPYFKKMDSKTLELSKKLGVKKGEIGVGYDEFFSVLLKSSKNCRFISFDYGQEYPREDFSLRVYKNHQTFPSFSLTTKAGEKERLAEFFGKSDITYDVNFAHIKSSMKFCGFKNIQIKSQMKALVEFGLHDLLSLFESKVDEKTYQHELQKAKQLILPAYFGERFKMILCEK
ncbi:MAG: hypothetical protein GX780_04745 [Campylobacteraceae bacterium]|nr:hypothetical protein [Campylobacteraceae bacterium]